MGVVAVLAVAVILLAGPGTSPAASPGPGGSVAAASGAVAGSTAPAGSSGSSGSVAPSSPGGSASPSGEPIAAVPIVPVVDFRSTESSVKAADVTDALGADKGRYAALELVDGDSAAILAALGVTTPAASDRLILAKDAATLRKDLAKNRDRLAFLRADQVTPAVRALAWGAKSLFGVDRVTTLAAWPLNATLATTAGNDPVRPGPDLDDGRRRRRDARPGRGQGRQDPGQGCRLPVQRRHRHDHRAAVLLGARQSRSR